MKVMVMLSSSASCSVEFDVSDGATDEEIAELALEQDMPRLCHQCTDSKYNQALEIGDEWDVTVDMDGKPEIYREDGE